MRQDWRGCLREFGWLDPLSDAELAAIHPRGRCGDFERGRMIFSPDRSPASVFLLRSGLVQIYRLSRAGAELTLGYVGPQEIFGELSGFSGFPRESYAVAVTPCRVCEMPQSAFRHLFTNHPDVLIDLVEVISRRLKRIESRLTARAFQSAFARTCAILIELSEDFGRENPAGTVIDIPLNQSELAHLIGSARQTVNPHIRRLEESGCLSRRGDRWIVVKPDEIARMATTG